jgi:hypothetical protein
MTPEACASVAARAGYIARIFYVDCCGELDDHRPTAPIRTYLIIGNNNDLIDWFFGS